MKRDSMLWTFLFIASGAVFLSGHFELLTRAFPALGLVWQARIELVAAIAGFIAGYLKMSPLALSEDSTLAGTSNPRRTLPLVAPGKSLDVVLLFVGVSLLSSACGATLKQSEKLLHDSIVLSEQHRCSVHAAPCLSTEQFHRVNDVFYVAAVSGAKVTRLEKIHAAQPSDYAAFYAALTESISAVRATGVGGPFGKALDYLTRAQQIVQGVTK